MDREVEIKEEPNWPEGTTNTSFDLYVNNTVDNDGIMKVESKTSITTKEGNELLDPRSEDNVKMDLYVNNTVDDDGIVKVESKTSITTKEGNELLDPRSEDNVKMDLYVNNTVDNDGIVKVESKTSITTKEGNEMLDPRSEDDVKMPAADIKDEIVKEESTFDQLTPTFKEENNVKNVPVSTNGVGPYCRSECSSTFSQRCNHLTTRSSRRLCSCAKCTFVLEVKKWYLLSHSAGRPCSICDGTFALKRGLIRHMLSHSGEGPYPCSICNNTFPQSSHPRHLSTVCGKKDACSLGKSV